MVTAISFEVGQVKGLRCKGDSSVPVHSGMKEEGHEVEWLGGELLAFTLT